MKNSIKIDFSRYSSIKIGKIFDVELIDEICEFSGVIIGGANNLLISPNPPKMGILSDKFDYIKLENKVLTIGAKTPSSKIYKFAKENDIGGFEYLSNIPGTLGGLITMNAGLKGFEISQNLLEIFTNYGKIKREDCEFAYRHSNIAGTIFQANFEVKNKFNHQLDLELKLKRQNQPKAPSFGSCFVNPKNDFAARLLQEAGLKGKRIGNCGFSDIHANFLINYGSGTFQEAISLINLAKKVVFERFSIKLRHEVVIL